MKSKQNLVQSTTIWLFTYNLSNVSIFFFTDNKSLVQKKRKKKKFVTWIKLLPITFTQQENTGIRWAVPKKKNNQKQQMHKIKNKKQKTTIPIITHYFPSC